MSKTIKNILWVFLNKYVAIGFGCFLLIFAGCNRSELGPLPTLAPTPTVQVQSDVSTGRKEESITPQITSKTEIKGQQAVYHGDTFKFYEVDEALYMQDPDLLRYKIRGVYEDVIFSDTGYNGLFVGQVVTMFGDENVTNDHEALLSYIVAAEDEAGDVIYLEVYFGPSGPAIGGSAGENYAKAAEELESVIRGIEPIDYECECTYFDLIDIGGGAIMGTKNGKGYYRMEIGGGWY